MALYVLTVSTIGTSAIPDFGRIPGPSKAP